MSCFGLWTHQYLGNSLNIWRPLWFHCAALVIQSRTSRIWRSESFEPPSQATMVHLVNKENPEVAPLRKVAVHFYCALSNFLNLWYCERQNSLGAENSIGSYGNTSVNKRVAGFYFPSYWTWTQPQIQHVHSMICFLWGSLPCCPQAAGYNCRWQE